MFVAAETTSSLSAKVAEEVAYTHHLELLFMLMATIAGVVLMVCMKTYARQKRLEMDLHFKMAEIGDRIVGVHKDIEILQLRGAQSGAMSAMPGPKPTPNPPMTPDALLPQGGKKPKAPSPADLMKAAAHVRYIEHELRGGDANDPV